MRSNSGQIALMVVLAMVILLTIGLSVASRSVTDIRISKETEESARAFSAAEAGIEEALSQDLGDLAALGPKTLDIPEIEVSYRVEEVKKLVTQIKNNDTVSVNLEGFAGDGLKISWENSGLELALLYDAGGLGNYKMSRFVLRNGIACGENFELISNMPYLLDLSVYDEPYLLTIRPICNDTTVTVEGDSVDLPAQSYKIHSTAIGPGGETRALEVTKSIPILSPLFNYVLFSGGAIQ